MPMRPQRVVSTGPETAISQNLLDVPATSSKRFIDAERAMAAARDQPRGRPRARRAARPAPPRPAPPRPDQGGGVTYLSTARAVGTARVVESTKTIAS